MKTTIAREDVNALCRAAAKQALRHLRGICADPQQRAQDRVAAAKVLLEYGVGKSADAGEAARDPVLTVNIEGAPQEWLE